MDSLRGSLGCTRSVYPLVVGLLVTGSFDVRLLRGCLLRLLLDTDIWFGLLVVARGGVGGDVRGLVLVEHNALCLQFLVDGGDALEECLVLLNRERDALFGSMISIADPYRDEM